MVYGNTKKFKLGAEKSLYNNVTCEKTWIYSYEIEIKQQSTLWVVLDKLNPMNVVLS